MLREARIVMPHGDTYASIMAHNDLRKNLASAFGGFTCFRGEGGWVDVNGNLIRDDVTIYDIAIDNDRDAPFDLLHRFAVEAGRALGQQSVYVRYPNGEVDIVDLEKTSADASSVAATLDRDRVLLDALTKPVPEPDVANSINSLFHALERIFGEGNVMAIDDVGDGRSAEHRETLPVRPQPGELWENRAGDHVFIGRRATVFDGGWYATETRTGFEYTVDHVGHLLPHVGPSHRDLVKRVH